MAALAIRSLPEHFIPLGPILKPYGTAGAFITDLYPESALDDFIFIEIEGIKVPFEIEELIDRSGQVVVKVTGVDDLEGAERLRGCQAFAAPGEDTDPEEEMGRPYQRIVGWRLLRAADTSLVGQIESYDDTTANVLLRIRTEAGEEQLIPWVEAWVVSLDEDHRRVVMELPDGLLE